jgi:hypothetical protein
VRQTGRLVAGLLAVISTAILASCYGVTLNTPNPTFGRIIFVNQANPTSSELFGFDISYGHQVAFPKGGKLSASNLQIDSGFNLTAGTYTISEYIPNGWQLTIDINDPSGDSSSAGSQATINLTSGETVTITYINTKINVTSTPTMRPTPAVNPGRIIINEQVIPGSSGEAFSFVMSYGRQIGYPNGLKIQNGYQVDSGFVLTPGNFTISEYIPNGWQLTIDINDPSGDSSVAGSQATINLAAGETVTVTYINTKSNVTPASTPSSTPAVNPGRIILK